MNNEHIYRALTPWKAYRRFDGTVSSAAFKDAKGASVELQCSRTDDEVAIHMHGYLKGDIAKIRCSICEESKVEIVNIPSNNPYHRILLNKLRANDSNWCLTDEQADILAENIVSFLT